MSTLVIRRAEAKDAHAIHVAHMRSINEVCAKDYTPQQLRVWGGRDFDPERRLSSIFNNRIWVVEKSSKICGYGELAKFKNQEEFFAYLHALYFTPEILGRGLGREIFERVHQQMRLWDVKKLVLNSTLTSFEFYKKMGMQVSGPLIELTWGDTLIPSWPMHQFII